MTITEPAQNRPTIADTRLVERVVCPTYADVLRIMRQYPHSITAASDQMAERDQVRRLVDGRLTAAAGPVPGTVVVRSHQGRLLAFNGDISTVSGLAIEFTTGARAPMHRLVAAGAR